MNNYTFYRGDELIGNGLGFCGDRFGVGRCDGLGARRRRFRDDEECPNFCPFPREEGRFSFLCQLRRLINRRIILNVRNEVLDVLLLDVGCDSIRVLDTLTDTIRVIRGDRIISFDEPQYLL